MPMIGRQSAAISRRRLHTVTSMSVSLSQLVEDTAKDVGEHLNLVVRDRERRPHADEIAHLAGAARIEEHSFAHAGADQFVGDSGFDRELFERSRFFTTSTSLVPNTPQIGA